MNKILISAAIGFIVLVPIMALAQVSEIVLDQSISSEMAEKMLPLSDFVESESPNSILSSFFESPIGLRLKAPERCLGLEEDAIVEVTWDASKSILVRPTSYRLSIDGGKHVVLLPASRTTYMHRASPAQTHTYSLRAFWTNSFWSEAVVSSISVPGTCLPMRPVGSDQAGDQSGDMEDPSTPQIQEITSPGFGRVSLKWAPATDNIGVDGYVIYRNKGFVTELKGTTYEDYGYPSANGLTPQKAYIYQIAAFDKAGNYSDISGQAFIRLPLPPAPQPDGPDYRLSAGEPRTVQFAKPLVDLQMTPSVSPTDYKQRTVPVWSQISGPSKVLFIDPETGVETGEAHSQWAPIARFSTPGNYILRMTVPNVTSSANVYNFLSSDVNISLPSVINAPGIRPTIGTRIMTSLSNAVAPLIMAVENSIRRDPAGTFPSPSPYVSPALGTVSSPRPSMVSSVTPSPSPKPVTCASGYYWNGDTCQLSNIPYASPSITYVPVPSRSPSPTPVPTMSISPTPSALPSITPDPTPIFTEAPIPTLFPSSSLAPSSTPSPQLSDFVGSPSPIASPMPSSGPAPVMSPSPSPSSSPSALLPSKSIATAAVFEAIKAVVRAYLFLL